MSVNDAMQYEMLCRREFGDFGMGSCSLADRLRISHTGNVFYKNSLVIKSSYILISKQPMSLMIPSKIFSIPVLGAYMRKGDRSSVKTVAEHAMEHIRNLSHESRQRAKEPGARLSGK